MNNDDYMDCHITNKQWPDCKWHWMMEYCKCNLLPPGEESNWKQAEKAYEERKKNGRNNQEKIVRDSESDT